MTTVKLTKRSVEAPSSGSKDIILRDNEIKGFLCKITPKGRRSYMLYYRTKEGQERKPLIGVHGDITCNQARSIALEWKAIIANGGDPSSDKQGSRLAPDVYQLCNRYMTDYATGRKKASSLRNDAQMIERFIQPAIGRRKATSITNEDITKLHNSLRKTPYQANRLLALLSKMFSLAEAWGIRPQGTNPTQFVEKFPEEKRQRYLSEDELESLGAVLDAAETDQSELPQVIAAIRLLLLTGCRLNEILTLKWSDIDWGRGLLNLEDTKSGYQVRPVGNAALTYLDTLSWKDDLEFVIPGRDKSKPLVNLGKPWRRIRDKAELTDVRIHDLRHTHASAAAGLGNSLPIIGRLLGHTQAATTQRYAHLADDPIRTAADQVAEQISKRVNAARNRLREDGKA
jgi:integrase